jgi:hypothetical protein
MVLFSKVQVFQKLDLKLLVGQGVHKPSSLPNSENAVMFMISSFCNTLSFFSLGNGLPHRPLEWTAHGSSTPSH